MKTMNIKNMLGTMGFQKMKRMACAALLVLSFSHFLIFLTSCDDMLENDSSRQLFDPELDQKTDTVFYALGILQAMQQLADHYVLQGEMRGDLVKTTTHTDNNLRQLANFSATTACKYDSAYVYYRVVNNCNYYIAHVDTTLRNGSNYVMMPEYVAVKSIRAWAYMQLARVYGSVPFYTEPLTQISQIDDGEYPSLDLEGVVSALAPDLEQYTGYPVPNYGSTPSNANFNPAYIFIPVDVVLGEMYLETGQYARAAKHYITWLTQVASTNHSAWMQPYSMRGRGGSMNQLPNDWASSNNTLGISAGEWSTIFGGTADNITYIPMAPSSLNGPTTVLPLAFGYDLYAVDKSGESRYIDDVQIAASDAFLNLSQAQDYYYQSTASTASTTVISATAIGDMRYRGITHERENIDTDSTQVWITKYNNARVQLFRVSTVLLHLAEALNRLGMPDAAFAILKDGISEDLIREEGGAAYLRPETRLALITEYPLLSAANRSKFNGVYANFGIHMHGCGLVRDYDGSVYTPGLTTYQMDSIVGLKLAAVAADYQVQVGTTRQDTINAMEDILCDEYALEFAFEGCRFYDLCRMARHKNRAALYAPNFGGRWLARRLAYKNPVVNLEDQSNWYLPFK